MSSSPSQYASTAEEVINEAIQRIPGPHKPTTTGIMVCCMFHADKTPSFGINLSTDSGIPLGYGHCLGCGEKAHWNKIAEKLGLPQLKRGDYKITSTRQKERSHLLMKRSSLKDIVTKQYRCSQYMPKWPINREWRTISGELMNKFAFHAFNPEQMREFAILPVTIDGELHGAIKAVTKKTDDPEELSYVTSKASSKSSWVKKYGLFPYDIVQEMLAGLKLQTVVLVEGPRDALRLIMQGIPALAILGSQAWSSTKMKMLLSLPITKVILMMDGDRAGRQANAYIFPTLDKHIDVELYDLSVVAKKLSLDKYDPAMIKPKRIEHIRRKLK